MEDSANIVIDVGTGYVKAGYAEQEAPAAVFPTVVGRVAPGQVQVQDANRKDMYIGQEAEDKRGMLTLSHPLSHGTVENWDEMEALYEHTFYTELRTDPEGRNVLLTEAPFNPRVNREKMTQIMFDKFNVGGMYVAVQAVLAMYASGRQTGLVLDSGDGVTHTVPVYEGFAVEMAMQRHDVAGRDLTKWMQRLLLQEGYTFETTAEQDIVREIKEALCMVHPDPSGDAEPVVEEGTFTLPDATTVTISRSRWLCPEALFHPEQMGRQIPGVHNIIATTIEECPIDMRKLMWENVILSGGTTMFEGFKQRLTSELTALANDNVAVKVISPPERKYSVWIGGSILASLQSFDDMLITRDEYDEIGPNIVHRKCL